jgi:hypothetical protein
VFLSKDGWDSYECCDCGAHFTVLSDSPFQKTKLNPKQLWALLELVKNNRLAEMPSALCKEVEVHHWTMTKLINRVKGHSPEELIGRPGIAGIEEMLIDLFKNDDQSLIIPALVLFTYRYVTQDPRLLAAVSGCDSKFAEQAIERIKSSWPPGEEFKEEDEFDWSNPEAWNSPKGEVILVLHCLCIMGDIKRDPDTKKWSEK